MLIVPQIIKKARKKMRHNAIQNVIVTQIVIYSMQKLLVQSTYNSTNTSFADIR
jgi:hypothetical protein